MSMLRKYRAKLHYELKRRRQKLIESGKVKPVVMRVKDSETITEVMDDGKDQEGHRLLLLMAVGRLWTKRSC